MLSRSLILATSLLLSWTAAPSGLAQPTYLGFDRNDYPGDASLPALRKTFSYTSYWLNVPPGDSRNTWTGKRALLKQQGFGFLVLFNGRMDAELKRFDPVAAGTTDGNAAVAAAAREGFRSNVLIFLDIEEGGRLFPEQHAYIFAWADAVRQGGARAGVYCSGIDVREGKTAINTAEDLIADETSRAKPTAKANGPQSRLVYWIANDQCPPAPGCTATAKPPSASLRLHSDRAVVWQYAQSPRRKEFTASCPRNYASDGNCYAPGLPHSNATFVDLNVANSPNPSEVPESH
jgi:hypothetical protein